MRLTVAIATAGRRQQLGHTLRQLDLQLRRPHEVLVCPATDEDYDAAVQDTLGYEVTVVKPARRGLCHQRNAILDAMSDTDIVVFLDDDYYPAPNYLEVAASFMASDRSLVVITNHPSLDGATGPGITHERALRALAVVPALTGDDHALEETYGAYGCNMVLRADIIRQHALRFDEALPLYAWLEDIDFSRRMAKYGRVMACRQLHGVHLGTKNGRQSGLRLGYSQIANPVYLMRKGSMGKRYGFRQMGRNLSKNLVRAVAPEPWVDRRGRLRGNGLALRDLVLGRLDPRAVLKMS